MLTHQIANIYLILIQLIIQACRSCNYKLLKLHKAQSAFLSLVGIDSVLYYVSTSQCKT